MRTIAYCVGVGLVIVAVASIAFSVLGLVIAVAVLAFQAGFWPVLVPFAIGAALIGGMFLIEWGDDR